MKTFKIRFDRKKQEKRFKAFVDKVKKDERWKDDAAELAIRNIKGRTRLGKFIADDSRQPALSKKWIERRQDLSETNPTGANFSPNKSNLTLTGQLLESLKRIKDKTRVIIAPTGARKAYTNKDGSRGKASSTPSNAELTGYLKEKGRKYLGFNEKLRQAIKKKFMEHIRRNLKNWRK